MKKKAIEHLDLIRFFQFSYLSQIRVAVGCGEPGVRDVERVPLGVDGLGLSLRARVRRVEVPDVGTVGNVTIVDNVLKQKQSG